MDLDSLTLEEFECVGPSHTLCLHRTANHRHAAVCHFTEEDRKVQFQVA